MLLVHWDHMKPNSNPATARRTPALDAEDRRDLSDPRIQAHIKASRAEHRAGKGHPAEKLQKELDAIAQKSLPVKPAAQR